MATDGLRTVQAAAGSQYAAQQISMIFSGLLLNTTTNRHMHWKINCHQMSPNINLLFLI